MTAAQLGAYLRDCPQTLVGEVLGLARQTVTERIRSGAWQTVGKSNLNLFDCAALEKKRLRSGPISIEAARLKKAQATSAELINAQRLGELVEQTEAEAVVAELASVVVQFFEALPARMAPMVKGETDDQAILAAFHAEGGRLRAELAEVGERARTLGAVGARRTPPAAPDARPVGRRKSKVSRRKS